MFATVKHPYSDYAISEMRGWLVDCDPYGEYEDYLSDEMASDHVANAVQRHFVGGLSAFMRAIYG